jgi:DNA polymerase-3 subunit delta
MHGMLRGMTARPDAPAPVNVIAGEEELLVERSVSALITAARLAQAGVSGDSGPDGAAAAGLASVPGDVHDVAAADLAVGELASLTSPSLFGGGGVVVIRAAQDAGNDVVLIVTHAGGAKGKALLTSLKKTPGPVTVIDCPKITRFSDRLDFVRGEFRRAGRVADEGGLRALLDAVGSDLREIAAACSQLASDVEGHIGEEAVARYYQGRAEASGFTVSDRAVEGRLADALEQLRWALATGVPPVLITSALAQGIRLLGRVGAAPRGKNSAALAAEVGAPPWKVDRVRQQLRGWAPEGVAHALQVVAEADAQIKGEAASPDFALERAVRRIVACRG